jgi:hypothetical protein
MGLPGRRWSHREQTEDVDILHAKPLDLVWACFPDDGEFGTLNVGTFVPQSPQGVFSGRLLRRQSIL